MSKESATLIVGIAIEIIFVIVDKQVEAMPLALVVTGYSVASVLIVIGVIGLIAPKAQIWGSIMRIRLRSPIGLKNRGSKETATAIPEATQHYQELTQEQVAERLAFIQRSRAVAERLVKNNQGAEAASISSILDHLCEEPPIKEYVANVGLVNQAIRLLKNQIDNLVARVDTHYMQTEGLSTSIDDSDVLATCNSTRRLVLDYRQSVDDVLTLLDNLEKSGVPALWQLPPWPLRIHRELADNYDELMRLVADLKAATPKNPRSVLPVDNQLTKFPRTTMIWP